jgi:hypothetical protein
MDNVEYLEWPEDGVFRRSDWLSIGLVPPDYLASLLPVIAVQGLDSLTADVTVDPAVPPVLYLNYRRNLAAIWQSRVSAARDRPLFPNSFTRIGPSSTESAWSRKIPES